VADDEFSAFVQTHGDELLRFAYLLCGDPGRAEDVVQEALVRLMRQWRSAVPDHPVAYARKAVLNEYLGWRRRQASREIVGAPLAEAGTADSADTHAERDLVWRLIRSLPPQARAVLVLRYYAQLPDRDIATYLGCAEATVRSIAARAFAALRDHPHLAVPESRRP
jgi:RNA polymerase sigma-70 factor (sigma-E family)